MQAFKGVANRLRVKVTDGHLAAFDIYAGRLLEENRRANLTSVRDRDGLYRRHFAESLALLAAIDNLSLTPSPVIDVGTGAGFPGIPIKIVRPEIDITLLEATGKKVRFLEAVVKELGLAGVTVIEGRAEEIAREPAHRGHYALGLARAVAPLRVLLEYTLPLLEKGGALATPKGSAAPRELREAEHALEVLGGTVEVTQPLELPFEGPQQTLIVVRKTGETPEAYPRRPGMPAKRPL